MSGRAWARLVVYTLLLVGLAGAGLVYQHRSVPAQVERALRGLGHRHPAVASRAWEDLHQLYFTKWAAVELVVAGAQDPRPISFLVQEGPDFVFSNAAPARRGFRPSGRPWFYKSESIPCRTVGDAIRAMLYNESDVNGHPRWKKDLEGDWDAWWTANRGYYGG